MVQINGPIHTKDVTITKMKNNVSNYYVNSFIQGLCVVICGWKIKDDVYRLIQDLLGVLRKLRSQ